ncbi:diacylglycerol/lipid kinase family protein [Mesorhizobium muleiense]|uniref:diacylglycerol/lipid kinase family protein n=1 Tax=Mesorhizobium muleiense TaxID=1004279 RepID=UPI003AFB06C4
MGAGVVASCAYAPVAINAASAVVDKRVRIIVILLVRYLWPRAGEIGRGVTHSQRRDRAVVPTQGERCEKTTRIALNYAFGRVRLAPVFSLELRNFFSTAPFRPMARSVTADDCPMVAKKNRSGGMRFAAVLNQEGGTLRTVDLSAFTDRMRQTLEAAGHCIDIEIVAGRDIVATLDRIASRHSVDIVLAGGGDGTISAAAARLMGSKKAIAILPAGTMNLFARGLGIPQTLDAAVKSFADGEVIAVDMATANGKPFVHQFSIGMHARMVQLRQAMEYGSRLGKMRASAKAAWAAINNPSAMKVTLTIGEAGIVTRTTGIGITNNLFGEGHLPYADNPAGGVLGIYVTVARRRGELVRVLFDMARGKWRDSAHVEIHQAERAVLKLHSAAKKFRAVMDGELVRLDRETTIEIHPGALNVLVPARAVQARAA